MTAQTPDLAAVVARLEKVERQNRRLRGAGIAVLVLAVAGLLMGQAMPRARKVEAERFLLEDETGKVRAMLMVDKDGPGLFLYDENGKTRFGASVDKDGSGLGLLDENGNPRVALVVGTDGPILTLTDENGKGRTTLAVPKKGPKLALIDQNGKLIWSRP
jgi:hypothetical protein